MKKKLLSVLLTLSVAAAALVGCGSAGGSSTTATTDTLAKVVKEQKLVVGSIIPNEPYATYNEEGTPEGYDIDVAYLLADSLGIPHENVEFLAVSAAERIPALESGKCDVIIGNFTITMERAQKIEFTDPYDAGGTGLMAAAGSGIKSTADLAGRKIGASSGSTNQISGESLIASGIDMELVIYDDVDTMEMALKSGQIEGIIGDLPYCAYKSMKEPEIFEFAIQDTDAMLIKPFYNALGVRRGDQMWLNYLNQFIFNINTDGSNAALYEKWLGSPRSVDLNPKY